MVARFAETKGVAGWFSRAALGIGSAAAVGLSGCASTTVEQTATPVYQRTAAYNPNALWHSYEPGNEPEDQLERIYSEDAVNKVMALVPEPCKKYPTTDSERKFFALTQKAYAMEMAAREMFPQRRDRPLWVDDQIKKAAQESCVAKKGS
jgi:hypothetical protein